MASSSKWSLCRSTKQNLRLSSSRGSTTSHLAANTPSVGGDDAEAPCNNSAAAPPPDGQPCTANSGQAALRHHGMGRGPNGRYTSSRRRGAGACCLRGRRAEPALQGCDACLAAAAPSQAGEDLRLQPFAARALSLIKCSPTVVLGSRLTQPLGRLPPPPGGDSPAAQAAGAAGAAAGQQHAGPGRCSSTWLPTSCCNAPAGAAACRLSGMVCARAPPTCSAGGLLPMCRCGCQTCRGAGWRAQQLAAAESVVPPAAELVSCMPCCIASVQHPLFACNPSSHFYA
jgi:hypothetical protein